MDRCSVVLLLVTELCSVIAAILCVVAIGAPNWRHVEVEISEILVIDAHQGLWKNCTELFGKSDCTSVDASAIGNHTSCYSLL